MIFVIEHIPGRPWKMSVDIYMSYWLLWVIEVKMDLTPSDNGPHLLHLHYHLMARRAQKFSSCTAM